MNVHIFATNNNHIFINILVKLFHELCIYFLFSNLHEENLTCHYFDMKINLFQVNFTNISIFLNFN